MISRRTLHHSFNLTEFFRRDYADSFETVWSTRQYFNIANYAFIISHLKILSLSKVLKHIIIVKLLIV